MKIPLTVEIITTQREHLFAVTKLLFGALERDLLRDPQSPVMTSVKGSFESGKKIIPDAAAEQLLGSQHRIKTYGDYHISDEYRINSRRRLEVDFINASCGDYSFDSSAYGLAEEELLEYFLPQRKYGGVNFIHNNNCSWNTDNTPAFPDRYEMGIWLERPFDENKEDDGSESTMLSDKRRMIVRAFKALESKGDLPWLRYMYICVQGDRLLKSAGLREAMEKLKAPVGQAPIMDRTVTI